MENDNLLPVAVLCEQYNIEISFLTSLTEFGLLEITTVNETQYLYTAQIKELEKMIRLYYELNINLEGIDAIAHLLHRVSNLQNELTVLRNKLGLYENN